jgi:hypothetical protein
MQEMIEHGKANKINFKQKISREKKKSYHRQRHKYSERQHKA